MNQQIYVFTCSYFGHEKEPITAYCMNQKCKEKQQCCSQCLLKKHKDHSDDCRSIVQIQHFIENQKQEIQNLNQLVDQSITSFQRLYQLGEKFFVGEKSKMGEFEQSLKKPKVQIQPDDLNRIKIWNFLGQSKFSETNQKILQSLLLKMEHFSENLQKIDTRLKAERAKSVKEFDFELSTKRKIKITELEWGQDFQHLLVPLSKPSSLQTFEPKLCFMAPIFSIPPIFNIQISIIESWHSQAQILHMTIEKVYKTIRQELVDHKNMMMMLEKNLNESNFHQFTDTFSYIKFWNSLAKQDFSKISPLLSLILKKGEDILIKGQCYSEKNKNSTYSLKLLQRSEKDKKYGDLIEQGLTFYNQQNLEQSYECFDRAAKLDNYCISAFTGLGNTLKGMGKLDEAIVCYDRVVQLSQLYLYILQNYNANGKQSKEGEEIQIKTSLSTILNQRGLVLNEQQKSQEAVECFDCAIFFDSTFVEAYKNKGFCLNQLNRFNESVFCFDQAIKINPLKAECYYNKGLILQIMKNYGEAIFQFDQAIKYDSKSSNAFYQKGNTLIDLNCQKQAIKCFDQALSVDPQNQKILISKGNALFDLMCLQDALDCFDQAIDLDRKNAIAYNNKGLVLFDLNRFEDAIQCYDCAISLEPKDSAAIFNKALALQELKKFEEAENYYKIVINLDPENFLATFNQGKTLMILQQYTKANQCFDKALTLNNQSSDAFYHKGQALLYMNQFEEAIKCYDQAINLDRNNFSAFNNKGNALHQLKLYQNAIQCYDQAALIDPSISSVHNNKGLSLSEMMLFDKAIQCFNKAISLDPLNAQALNNKGDTLFQMQFYEEAISCYDQALNINPQLSQALNNKGLALSQLKNFTNAIDCYDRAIQLNPLQSQTFTNKGDALIEAMCYDDAIGCYEQAINIQSLHSIESPIKRQPNAFQNSIIDQTSILRLKSQCSSLVAQGFNQEAIYEIKSFFNQIKLPQL